MQFSNLDEIDSKILNYLMENGRMSYVDLAKKVNLSRVAVKSRIESLLERGIIERFTIIINPQKVGRNVSAYFTIEVEPQYLYRVAETLAEYESITDIYQMTGSSLLHVHAILELNEDLEEFLRRNIYSLKGIKRIDTHILISRIKMRKGIRV
ncbi:Regulatory protein AsnC [Koleobacter methoxysyntrophicus]|jgi:DNA-binding Lrp family transcriptional regulator|uniref:Regulatory protein AsnC n=1 Tax=Koleobacter methoxysyntrophicus TaxID=2751313 RepID=A0A8A0RPS3_9FIRM|nr:Lrp/AsnC family transcriptional regulator [Koleobacter methoxysyntrophicus]MDK2901270.1 hypothetical protein [Thermosediminibacterales bacterium]QSQ10253.1 Regulatory protein AsnC [Koleobacter methoxysyntrophicus]